jgi:UDP-glucose 4-epimerase
MTKCLVTGGAGFIGGALVSMLTDSGKEVVIYDNLSKGTTHKPFTWKRSSNCEFIHGDMLDQTLLREVVNTCDSVFHLAANPDVRLGSTDTRIDYEQNLLATYNLLEAMRISSNCKKMLFASSSTVYGEPASIPTPESYSPLIPISLYGASKLGCEALISGYCNMFEMRCNVIRLANIVGPNTTKGVVHDLFTKLAANPKCLDILGNGMQVKSYLYVSDCVNALIKLASEMKQPFEVFNAGSNDSLTVLDIVQIIMKELSLGNVKQIFHNSSDGKGWKGDVTNMLLDCSKLEASGWKPKYNSREAVVLTVKQMLEEMKNHHPQINLPS